MRVNADFDKQAVQHTETMPWRESPMPGVSRRMLDRVGEEVARATSIVRYEKGSKFSPPVHSGGEEFLVLRGVFQDEHGDYPEGTYVRNPIDTSHTPASEAGCEIFVKLWQFHPSERDILRVDTKNLELSPEQGTPGAAAAVLFADERETVRLHTWAPGTTVEITNAGGFEALVLDGSFKSPRAEFGKHAWLRLPKSESLEVVAGPEGARIWSKSGHLNSIVIPPQR